jgi:hypothetical protein
MALLLAPVFYLDPMSAAAQTNQWIREENEFINLIDGKTLNRFLIKLSVGKDGTISGTGAGIDVKGNWYWQGDYFCRSLFWGEQNLGSDCQKVELINQKLFFTADQGSGATAGFTIK